MSRETHALDALFRPRSVAILGASGDPDKIGGRPLAFLRRAGYGGRVVAVNPRAERVQGFETVRSLRALTGQIEHAIVAVPAGAVDDALADCREAGVRAVQVFSTLPAAGEGSAAADDRLRAYAAASGIRVLGPNCLGLFTTDAGFFGTFATALDGAWPRAGNVAIATQSGAFGSYFFGIAERRGLGISTFVSTGNEADVSLAECLGYLADDPFTRVIVLALEGCRDGTRLRAALAQARAAGKCVIALKVGTSPAGVRAAATHTGALTGGDSVFDAVFEAAGAFRARSLEEAADVAYLASAAPALRGDRLAIATTSGGIGVLLADAAEARGFALPEMPATAQAEIAARVPLAAGSNPLDTSTGILHDPGLYADLVEVMLTRMPVDAVLCFFAHLGRNPAHWEKLRARLYALRKRFPGLPFVAVLLADEALTGELEEAGFAVFADPTRAVAALAAYRTFAVTADEPAVRSPARRRLEGTLTSEPDAAAALHAAGIPFPPFAVAHRASDAARLAKSLGFPVVLKVVSPDLPHKSDVGGVELDLRSARAVRAAYGRLLARVRSAAPGARIDGVMVASQRASGVELLVGTHTDPVFGPVVALGAGGVLSELLDDVVCRPAPVTPAQAREMLERTRISRLCHGFRGRAAVDIDAVAHLVARLSEIAVDSADRIAAIDLNPVLARADGACALDALIDTRGEAA